jgi:hypothetical protein
MAVWNNNDDRWELFDIDFSLGTRDYHAAFERVLENRVHENLHGAISTNTVA